MTVPATVVAVLAASDDLLPLVLPFVDTPQLGQKFAPSVRGAPHDEQ